MREMKDSGIAWVGMIPLCWDVMENKYVMHKRKDIVPVYKDEDILSLTMNGVIVRDLDAGGKMPTSFDGYQKLTPGNLLMCLFDYDVTPRCIGLIKNNGVTSPAYSQFVLDKGNSSSYYYYYYLMIDHTKALLHMAKNLRHSFTEEQLGMINTPVPPIDEQNRIASFLDTKCAEIDALSADIQKEIDTLQEYRKSVITEAVTKGLDPNVEMKESGIDYIGMSPANWKLYRIKYLLNERNVRSQTGEEILLSVSQKKGVVPSLSIQRTTFASSLIGYKKVKKNDLVFNKLNPVLARFGVSAVDGITSPDFSVYCTNNLVDVKFLCHLLKTEKYVVEYGRICTGVGDGFSRLYSPMLYGISVALPLIDEQINIANFLDSKCAEIDSIIVSKQKQLETLAEYRKSLIYEYVTGKKEAPTV